MKLGIIGNIIIDSETTIIEDIFQQHRSINDVENDLPILYVGYYNSKANINNFNILEKEVEKGKLYWTFKITERRNDFEEDIKKFKKICYERIINKTKIIYPNFLLYTYSDIKKLFSYINYNKKKKIIYESYDKKTLFIYEPDTEFLFSFPMVFIEYIGVKRDKVERYIKKIKNKDFINDYSFLNKLQRDNKELSIEMLIPIYYKLKYYG